MPKLEAGWEVLPVEELILKQQGIVDVFRRALASSCLLITYPFVATVSIESLGLKLEVAIGVGSLVCEQRVLGSRWVLASPAWACAVRLRAKCEAYVSRDIEEKLSLLGLDLESFSSLDEAFKKASQGGRGLVILPGLSELDVELSEGLCGRLSTPNPLHPAAVVGKANLYACVNEVASLVGPKARLLRPLLALDGKEIAWSYKGLGELTILGFDPFKASSAAMLSGLLAALYSCGEPLD